MLGDFQDIEAKCRFDMGERVILVRYDVAKFLLKFGIEERHGAVGSHGMACDICGVVCECSQRKRIIIQRLRFARVAEERKNKIPASHIVGEIAEKDAPVGVIAQVLNNGAAISVPVCLAQFVRRSIWEMLEQDGFDVSIPGRIDDRFMREYRVGRAARRPRKNDGESANRGKTSSPDSMSLGWQNIDSSLPSL